MTDPSINLTSAETAEVSAVIVPQAASGPAPAASQAAETPKAESQIAERPAHPAVAAPAQPIWSESLLPPYTRSLLKIRLPVRVSLASTKQSVDRVLQMVPGTIIQFDKSCDELLDLEVGGLTIAQGETVKIGEKFGLRVKSLVRPRERFHTMCPRQPDASSPRLPAGNGPPHANPVH